jgi:hypothetical protein
MPCLVLKVLVLTWLSTDGPVIIPDIIQLDTHRFSRIKWFCDNHPTLVFLPTNWVGFQVLLNGWNNQHWQFSFAFVTWGPTLTIWEKYFTIPNIRADLYLSTKADKKGEETKNYIFLSYKIVCRELETREINSLRLVVALNSRSQFDALVSSSLDVAQSMQIIKLLVDMFGF